MSQYVDYTNPELKHAPRKARPHRRETMYLVVCSRCGHSRYLARCHAVKAEKNDACRVCACRIAGAKGFAALVAKYGIDSALDKLREHRLNHPTDIEQVIIALLDAEHISYKREFPLKTEDGILFYDFAFDNVLVEVDGTYWHQKSEAKERDAYKDAVAVAQGFILVRIKEERIKDARSQLYAALQDERYLAL